MTKWVSTPNFSKTSTQSGTNRHILGSLTTKRWDSRESFSKKFNIFCLYEPATFDSYQSGLNARQSSHLEPADVRSSSWMIIRSFDSQWPGSLPGPELIRYLGRSAPKRLNMRVI